MNVPNVIILGVGHSGTRVIIDILDSLGWYTGMTDQHGEITDIVSINSTLIASGEFDAGRAQRIIDSLRQPWAIKDPRFIYTLPNWLKLQLGAICLLHVHRDINDLYRSWSRRDEHTTMESLTELCRTAENIYNAYDGLKLSLSFEQVIRIVEKFDINRAKNIQINEKHEEQAIIPTPLMAPPTPELPVPSPVPQAPQAPPTPRRQIIIPPRNQTVRRQHILPQHITPPTPTIKPSKSSTKDQPTLVPHLSYTGHRRRTRR